MQIRPVCALLAIALVACATSESSAPDAGTPVVVGDDADRDGISDDHEGRTAAVDSDGDGTADYLDADSDGDGLTDALEAGDADLTTAAADSDRDGTPDFRDLDSDGNGRPDAVDGTADLDGDGRADFADDDDDGDRLSDAQELGPSPASPVDTDGDRTADFHDADSDADSIADVVEGADDYDQDTSGNFQDLDSDGDCRLDAIEVGGANPVDTDGDRRPDYLDRDIDDDGVLDRKEDADCDGVVDPGETDPRNADTDGDGASDMVEEAANTRPTDAGDHPQARGDFVFVEPYRGAQTPVDDRLAFATRLRSVDLYVMLDRSGSMREEIESVRRSLGTVIDKLTCPPLGSGSPATCIPDLWAGAATIGYQRAEPFTHVASLQPAPQIGDMVIDEPSQGYNSKEPITFALWSAITGQGSATSGCPQDIQGPSVVAPQTACDRSPAAVAGFPTFGYPCFRVGALPVVLLATDEPPLVDPPPPQGNLHTYTCPSWNAVVRPALAQRGAKVVGVVGFRPELCGQAEPGCTANDLATLARDTGTVDADTRRPLVFTGATAGASADIENGVRTLATGLPLDLSARAIDDASDGVDAVAAFVDHLETLQEGAAPCTGGLTAVDTNGDTFHDQFTDVRTGVPVCWKLVSKPNTTVVATDQAQLLKATVEVRGDGVTVLDAREVYFLVPPRPADPPVD